MGRDRRHSSGKQRDVELRRIRARAKKLVEQTGLPLQRAMSVARDELSLSEAISMLARADEVRKLMRKHDLSKSIATQVTLGQTDLDEYLEKRALRAYIQTHREISLLDEWGSQEKSVWLLLHGREQMTGQLQQVNPYDLQLLGTDGQSHLIHKLHIKMASLSEVGERLNAEIRTQDDAGSVDPIEAPQDRFRISDRRLYEFMKNAAELEVTTVEGDQVRGSLRSFSRWDSSSIAVKRRFWWCCSGTPLQP